LLLALAGAACGASNQVQLVAGQVSLRGRHPADPTAKTFPLVVLAENCGLGQPALAVTQGGRAVVVTATFRRQANTFCAGADPPSYVTLHLRAPLGRRVLLDGNSTPPSPMLPAGDVIRIAR